jgi:O-antigen ligase
MHMGTEVQSADQIPEGDPVERLVYTSLLAFGILVLVGRRTALERFLRANGLVLLFFFYCLLSLMWSDYPDVAFKRWIKAIGDLVMLFVVFSEGEPLVALKRLLARTTYVLIPLSILFIKYYPLLGRRYEFWNGHVTYLGVTTNKNALGAICLCLGLGALWRLFSAYREKTNGWKRSVTAEAVIVAMVAWLLCMANSMTSLSCFIMGSILLFATNLRYFIRRPTAVHGLVAAMMVISGSVLFFGASPEAFQTLGRNATLTGRTEVWGMLLSLGTSAWVGTGFESFWLGSRLERIWDRYWWHPTEAHNGYLEVFLNLGWLGVGLLLVIIAVGYKKVFRAWRDDPRTGCLLLTYFFVGLIYNFTEAAFFRMQAPVWIFFLLAIVAVSAVSIRKIRPAAPNLFQHPDWRGDEQQLASVLTGPTH